MPYQDLTGQRFDRLLVVSYAGSNKWGTSLWNCICDCGTAKIVHAGNLRKEGQRQSCGCWRREISSKKLITHSETIGHAPSKEYSAWSSMIRRCENPNTPNFHLYGGRGIEVCHEWRISFESFLSYIGRAPSLRHVLDRFPNQNGNYEPGNVRWATPKESLNNVRTNKLITAFGVTKTQQQWAEEVGISRDTISYRLRAGLSAEEALTKAVQRTCPKKTPSN